MKRIIGWCLAAGSAAIVAAPAAAELFRCEGPDGRPVFTDQKGTCPGADAFEPTGVVLSAPTPAASSGSPSSGSAPASRLPLVNQAEAAQELRWQQKKLAAEEEIAKIRRRRESLRSFVTHCNRGGYVTTRDDAGIKHQLSCTQLRADFAALDDEEAAAQAYLEDGLREECRKAGCLPGWIR